MKIANSKITDPDHKAKPRTVSMSDCIVRACKQQSINDGHQLNDTGSLNHFVNMCVLKELKRRGLNYNELHPSFYIQV